MSGTSVESAYRYCESVTRKHAKSFHFAARFLPREKQIPVFAVYAFCRHVDDEIDESGLGSEEEAAAAVEIWRDRLEAVYATKGGRVSEEASGTNDSDGSSAEALDLVFAAWKDLLQKYPIPRELPLDLTKGVLMDTYKKRYSTFEELYVYCYHVASTVGLMSSEILGYSDPVALEYAEAMGVAMQLTNILRDVREDAEMGRIYIPAEDLERFEISEEQIFEGKADARFREMMAFQVSRARDLYTRGEQGIPYLSEDSRFTVLLASRIYGKILNEIERIEYDVFSTRAHTTKAQKLFSMPRIWNEARRMEGKTPFRE